MRDRLAAEDFAKDVKGKVEALGQEAKQHGTAEITKDVNPSLFSNNPANK